MANYPRFLYSDPQDTKKKGPYLVHLHEPRMVFKVEKSQLNQVSLVLLDKNISETDQNFLQVLKDANTWIHYQIKDGKITF